MRAQLISSSPGSGKTTAVAKAVRKEGVSVCVVTGNLNLARELSVEHGYALIEGRNENNCQRHDVVRALGDAGHDVEALACGKEDKPCCRFRAGCAYYGQFKQPGQRVGAAEQMFNKHFLGGGRLLVVDDADLPRSLISQYVVSAEELGTSYKQLKGKKRANLRTLLTILGHAVLSAPTSDDGCSQSLSGSAVWDHIAHTARLYGSDIVALLEALPKRPSLPEPDADQAGVVTREAVEKAPPATLLLLLNALRDELEGFASGEDFNSRLRLTRDGIEVRRLKEHARDRWGAPLVGQMDVLVLDATPVMALVDHLTQHHERLPDVSVTARLPGNVKVRQYATSTNGHAVLQDPNRVNAVLGEIAAERQRSPVESEVKEGVVCFQSLTKTLVDAGFAESQVVTFGSVRGTNALAGVERLHVVGRPTPPVDELPYLAQVIHFGEANVSGQIVLRPQAYGGQAYEVDVIDYGDPRLAALLKGVREDEIVQAVHRGRLFSLSDPQLHLVGEEADECRQQVELVLHTSQPIPGLRVDELILKSEIKDVNREQHNEAVGRIRNAVFQLQEQCLRVNVSTVLRISGGSRTTVTRVLKEGVHTLNRDLLYKGPYTLPNPTAAAISPSPLNAEIVAAYDDVNVCRGGCGKPMPERQMCFECATKSVEEYVRQRKDRKRPA